MSRTTVYHHRDSKTEEGSKIGKLINSKLHFDGYVYIRDRVSEKFTNWHCQQSHKIGCRARATTSNSSVGEVLTIVHKQHKRRQQTSHNHPPSFASTNEFKRMTKIETISVNDGLRGISQKLIKKESNSDTENELASDSLVVINSDKLQKDADSQVKESTNFNATSCSSTLDDNRQGQTTTRLIGKRLCIDGYIYYAKRYAEKTINWVCLRCSSELCTAKAVTSIPTTNKILVVYKGLEKSKHNHPASLAEVKRSEVIAAKHESINKKPKSQAVGVQPQSSLERITWPKQESGNPVGSEKINRIPKLELKQLAPTTVAMIKMKSKLSRLALKANTPKLIGKRLFINGYIYHITERKPGKIYWRCKRYSKDGCHARAATCFPVVENKLIVLKGPDVSKHNHPPYPEDVVAAKKLAKVERSVKTSKSLITADDRSPSKLDSSSSSNNCKKAGGSSESKLQLPSTTKKKVLPTNKIQGVKKRGLLHNRRKYRKFLTAFSKKPVFDKENVTEVLRSIYTSKGGRSTAYASVLENRKKVELDLQFINKSNPRVVIENLDSSFFTDLKHGKMTLKVTESEEVSTDFHAAEMELSVNVSSAQRGVCDNEDVASIPGNQSNTSRKNNELSRSSVPIVDLRDAKSGNDETTAMKDLTHDLDVKQELLAVRERTAHPLPIRNEPSLINRESHHQASPQIPELTDVVQKGDPFRRLNCDSGMSSTSSVSQSRSPDRFNTMLLDHRHRGNDSRVNPLFNCSRNHFNFNRSKPTSDVQIPLIINVPKLKDDGTSGIEQFYAEIQINY